MPPSRSSGRLRAGSGCGAAGGAAAADSSRLMGVDRLGRRSCGDCLRLRLRSSWLLQRPENDATRVSRSAVGRYARQWWLGIISLDAMSGLGTVQRCHNPVVMPPLHGGLPPLGSWSLYIHICETKITLKIAEHHMRVLNEDNSLNAPPLAGPARGWSHQLISRGGLRHPRTNSNWSHCT